MKVSPTSSKHLASSLAANSIAAPAARLASTAAARFRSLNIAGRLGSQGLAAATGVPAIPPSRRRLCSASCSAPSGVATGAQVQRSKTAIKTMPSLRAELADLARAAIANAYPDLAASNPPIVAACAQIKFGDYQCNNAMPLFAKLKGNPACPKAPRDVANAIVAGLPAGNAMISETSLAGPGFINIRVSREFLAK